MFLLLQEKSKITCPENLAFIPCCVTCCGGPKYFDSASSNLWACNNTTIHASIRILNEHKTYLLTCFVEDILVFVDRECQYICGGSERKSGVTTISNVLHYHPSSWHRHISCREEWRIMRTTRSKGKGTTYKSTTPKTISRKEEERASLGGIRTRTHDTLQSRRAFYQLSYQGNSAGRAELQGQLSW